MLPLKLTDDQWQKILPVLRSCPHLYVGKEDRCRTFVETVLWIARSGAQWRLLPKDYGDWNAVYIRFARWSQNQVFDHLHQHFAAAANLEYLMIDATVIRAHPCAAAALKKTADKSNRR